MNGVARIAAHDGGIVLPLRTPYDRQVLFEHVAHYAKRHGRVRLEFDRKQWSVSHATEHSPLCVGCNERPDKLAYSYGDRVFCHPCARRGLN